MFKNEKKTFGFRKASNVTTIGGTEVGTTNVVKGAIIAGATLAVIPFVGGHSVSADEVTAPTDTTAPTTTAVATTGGTAENVNPNPATNLEPAQPAQTEANVSANANAGQTAGDATVTAPITDPALDASVAKAEQTGVDVTKEANKEYTKEADAKADLASQKTAVDKATAEKQANIDAIKQANAKNAQIDKDNAVINQTNADSQTKFEAEQAKYLAEKKAYDDALANKSKTVTTDTVFTGRGSSEQMTHYGQTTADKVTIDQDGNWVLKEPQSDQDGTFGYTTVKGKFIYTTTYDEATKQSVTVISKVQINSWQLDLSRATTAINRNISASYKDINGNLLFSKSFNGGSSIAPITINKIFDLSETIKLSNGETSPEFMLLKTVPNWVYEAPSSLYAKLTYKTSALPVVSTPPTAPTLQTIKPHVTVPEVKTVTVAVHPVSVSQVPEIIKGVVNDSGVDVNGKLVPKNSQENYVLDLPTLNAGRPVYKDGEIVVHDALPTDLKQSLEEIKALNPAWTFYYDEATNSYSAKPTEVELANINKTDVAYSFKDLTLPVSPQNDNGTYNNTYSLALGGYLVYSNKVTFYTPGTDDPNDKEHGGSTIQPTKQVIDLEGNDINNKPVQAGQQIKYVGKWDLDQYKDIVAGAVAISKGFGFIDNYDETKETIDVKGTTIKSASGKDVTGLTPYVIKNLADAPQAIKDLVIASGVPIGDNDEFVIWVADDKQDFFDTYVVTGDSIFFTMPATIKDDVKTGDSIDNIVYQIDFGNGYAGNWVHNPVENPVTPTGSETPTPTPTPVAKGSVKAPALPTTGEKGNNFAVVGMAILSMLGLVGYKKKETK